MTPTPPSPEVSAEDWIQLKQIHDSILQTAREIISVEHTELTPQLFFLFEAKDRPDWFFVGLDPRLVQHLYARMRQGAIDEFVAKAFITPEAFSTGKLRGVVQINEGWATVLDRDYKKSTFEQFEGVPPGPDGRIEMLLLLFRLPDGLVMVSHGIETRADGTRHLHEQPFPDRDNAGTAQTIIDRDPSQLH